MNERMSIGAGVSTGFPELFEFCGNLMLEDGLAIDDRGVRSKLASWAVKASGLKYTSMRAISALSKGERPGPENSIGKLVRSEEHTSELQSRSDLVCRLLLEKKK